MQVPDDYFPDVLAPAASLSPPNADPVDWVDFQLRVLGYEVALSVVLCLLIAGAWRYYRAYLSALWLD